MVGLGVDCERREIAEVFCKHRLSLSISFFLVAGLGQGKRYYFVNKFFFPSSRCFLGSVQIAVLDLTFITMLYTVLFSLYF